MLACRNLFSEANSCALLAQGRRHAIEAPRQNPKLVVQLRRECGIEIPPAYLLRSSDQLHHRLDDQLGNEACKQNRDADKKNRDADTQD